MLRGAHRLAVRVVDNPWCNGCQLAQWSVKPQPPIPAKPSTGQQEHPSKGERATYEMFRRDSAPMVLTGVEDGFPPHGLPPALCFLFLVGQLIPDRFQVLIGFLQAGADLVDGPKDGNVIVCYALFSRMFAEELLNEENLFEQGLLRRIVRHVFDLSYEVVPRDVAHDRNDMPAFLPIQKIEITHDERDKQQRTEN